MLKWQLDVIEFICGVSSYAFAHNFDKGVKSFDCESQKNLGSAFIFSSGRLVF
jgi:hypothetical protein